MNTKFSRIQRGAETLFIEESEQIESDRNATLSSGRERKLIA
jgi:hypothetical protein